ncbi:hypothetical protein THAOC_19476 [Thalassiosira oceanica]|uniref:Uncharacterized protein n=1 Tax=Thalassiosira oceanica TaxID=159749 RepID=K0SGW9_THAOC|nr:hypothetical protein THAOC_19476 [Thalassiosira oceanica]|eukprot:EJK60221.1 hypothetical protein THAOC_19476 [Thalassiosira oceanica]
MKLTLVKESLRTPMGRLEYAEENDKSTRTMLSKRLGGGTCSSSYDDGAKKRPLVEVAEASSRMVLDSLDDKVRVCMPALVAEQ